MVLYDVGFFCEYNNAYAIDGGTYIYICNYLYVSKNRGYPTPGQTKNDHKPCFFLGYPVSDQTHIDMGQNWEQTWMVNTKNRHSNLWPPES